VSDTAPGDPVGLHVEPLGVHVEAIGRHVEVRSGGLGFQCPRCAQDVTERFYGPCGSCRRQLVEGLGGDRREIEVARFEPAMHVTPNAVATKD
jgi:predicted RNA-binding Zn-ribbon protein involved in translation (DUF1610 family)